MNPRFIKTVDLDLVKRLLARHADQLEGFTLDLLDQDEADARSALADLFAGPEEGHPEGLRGDLHRIAELGTGRGLEIIQAEAQRAGIDLFPEMRTADDGAANAAHDPKHIALRVFLEHSDLFDTAADHMAMVTADRLHPLVGQERGVTVDLTDEKVETFRSRVAAIFRDAFHGDFCRVGDYLDGDEVNLVIGHGSVVSTVPVVEGEQERVISIRELSHAVLRYSEITGILSMARIKKAHRADIAELFASIILGRPGFFDGAEARSLYTLRPVERAGFGFELDHRYDPLIDEVLITEAAADQMVPGRSGHLRVERSLRSRKPTGGALQHLANTQVDFHGSWRLGELAFRIFFKSDGKRRPQVTVKLRPPDNVQFRRSQHEKRVETLIERNGLLEERDDTPLIDAAE